MANPYAQASAIAAPFAQIGNQLLSGQNAYEQGRTKMAQVMAQEAQMKAHSDLFNAQADKARSEAQIAQQRAQYQTPEFATKLAANLAGLSEAQGGELAGYQQRGNWGVKPGAALHPDQSGPPMPDMPDSVPDWYKPDVERRFNQARGVALGNLAGTGNSKIDDMTKAFVELLGQNRTDQAIANPRLAAAIAQGVAAGNGKALVNNLGGNGVFNQFTGAQDLNAVGTSAAMENRAQAGNASASAALHRAQIPEVQARTELTKSKIGQAQTITMPDGTVVSTGAPMPKLTEIQAKSQLFGSRAAEADRLIRELEGKYSPAAINAKMGAEGVWGVGGALGAAGNAMLSKEGQMAEQAQRDFINAVLRQESGAVIGESEFSNAKKQYFPQPGDSKEVLAQKMNNRRLAIEGLKVMAGPASSLVNYGGKPQQNSNSSALAEAKAAIQAGAPRELVIQRLKQMGIDGGGI